MHADLLSFITTHNQVDIAILFQITVNLGSTTMRYRYAVDNVIITTDELGPWMPWPVETQEFIRRISDDKQPTDITIYDPDDTDIPGTFKRLLQYEKILNRAQFDMWLIVKDPSTHYSLSYVKSGDYHLNFAPIQHNLGVHDRLRIGDEYFTVLSVDGYFVEVDNKLPPPSPNTVFLPFYKDQTTWIKKASGRLRKASFMDGYTVLTIGAESDMLGAKIPKCTFSYQCPYIPGDKNCVGFHHISPSLVIQADYDIISTNGRTVVIQGPISGSTVPANRVIPPSSATKTDYWTLASFVCVSGSLAGIVRSVRSCVFDGFINHPVHKYTLTLDQAVPTLSGAGIGTVRLHFNCNRSYDDCMSRFVNHRQFGGMESIVRAVGGLNVPRNVIK